MNKATVISNVIISVILNLLFGAVLIGAGVLVWMNPIILETVLNAAFALIGLTLVLSTVPMLISGIVQIKQKKGKFDLIFSIITMVIGLALAFYGVASALLAFGVSMHTIPEIVGQITNILRWVIGILVALYLIVLPIIRIVKAEKKALQFKAELIKLILGVLILVLVICGSLITVLNQATGIVLIVIGALTVLLAILHLIIGLIGISKAAKDPAVAVVMDVDGDGVADAVVVDTDGDGKADAVGMDVDGDGKIDVLGVDTDGDGKVDKVVTND